MDRETSHKKRVYICPAMLRRGSRLLGTPSSFLRDPAANDDEEEDDDDDLGVSPIERARQMKSWRREQRQLESQERGRGRGTERDSAAEPPAPQKWTPPNGREVF